jgi:CPA2 family monovalent cation:H+ antiporter-2
VTVAQHGLPAEGFLVDLTLVLCVAGVTTVVFQRLRQPVILGYLLAGAILGPSVPVPLSADPASLELLAQLGVILLMFSVGLDLSVRRLLEVGPSSAFVAALQLALMSWLGFSAGRAFGWTTAESLFTGAIVAISSTLLIRKVFLELGVEREIQETVTGITVFEDLLAILVIAALSAYSAGTDPSLGELVRTATRLVIFLALMIAGGLFVVPRAIRFVLSLRRRETLLVASIGLCFAAAIFARQAGYSVALGAFLAGSLVAESGHGDRVQAVIEPVRDLFAALFFVSIGMSIDPAVVLDHWGAVLALTSIVVLGKLAGVSLGVFLTGRDLSTSLRAGFSMAQIGELSFVIASIGVASGAVRPFLVPIAIGVSSVTAFLSPILIRGSAGVARWIDHRLPRSLQTFTTLYGSWLEEIRAHSSRDLRWRGVKRSSWIVFVDALALTVLTVAAVLARPRLGALLGRATSLGTAAAEALVAAIVGVLALIPLLGMLRGSRKLGAALAELALPAPKAGRDAAQAPRRALIATLQLAVFLCAALPVAAVTEPFLPRFSSPLLLLVLVAALFLGFWRSAENLQGHVRAGAEIIVEALARSPASKTAQPLELAQEILPGLGEITTLELGLDSPAVGRTLSEVDLHGRSGASVVAITRGPRRIVMPGGNEVLHAGDVLAFTGSQEAIDGSRELLVGEPGTADERAGAT